MRFLSLFSGIGGLDLGLELAGFQCVGQVEIDPYNRRVLAKNFPGVKCFEDVRTVDGDSIRPCGKIDLVAGGFPCQDISNVGDLAGIEGKKSGLWGEFYRIICSIRPRFVLVENVSALLNRGFGRVLGDLAAGGFDAEWDCIPACTFGAPHHRDRVFIVGQIQHTESKRRRTSIRILSGIGSVDSRNRARSWAENEPAMAGMDDGVPNRLDRRFGLGNAVVPQVAEWIGLQIMKSANLIDTSYDPA